VTTGWRCEGPGTQQQDPPSGPVDIEIDPSNEDGVIAVTTLRELRDADLTEWFKYEALLDIDPPGASTVWPPTDPFGSLTEAQLDAPLENAMTFDSIAVEETENELLADGQVLPNPLIQNRGLFSCGGRWKDKKKSFDLHTTNGNALVDEDVSKNLGNGYDATLASQGSLDGTLTMDVDIYYRERSNKCIGVPYRWDFSYADISILAEMDGGFDVTTTLTIEQRRRLWEKTYRLLTYKKTIPIAKVITIDIRTFLDLQLALDMETKLTLATQTRFDQDYDIRGRYEYAMRCTEDGCDDVVKPDWNLDFIPVERSSINNQVTLDVTIRPSAELQLGVKVDAGILGAFEETLFDGRLGYGAALPVRLYWTKGSACSDADGDGINEPVETLLVDATVYVYAYVEGRLLGNHSREFISLRVPTGWLRKEITGLLEVDDREQVLAKNLFTKVLREGEHSALQPTINRAGIFNVGSREFEGVELGPVRSCYPFDEQPTVRVDFGNSQQLFAAPRAALPIPFDWPNDGANSTVRARIEFDEAGRQIKGPWVEVDIDANSNRPVELTEPVIRLGTGPNGPELQWEDNGAARGFNIYRDGNYVDTVRGVNSWSLANEDGQEHRYTVVAFDDELNLYTAASNVVIYGGGGPTGLPRAIVSMGDSYISGEGGRWLGNALSASGAGTDRGKDSYVGGSEANNCHRSDVAEVHSAAIAGVVPINIACSGATTAHVIDTWFKGEAPQVAQLREQAASHDIEMIVLSIGGNDLGFGEILTDCITQYTTGGNVCRDDQGVYSKIVREVIPKVDAAITAIEQTMAEVRDDEYRIVLQSYVSPVPRSSEIRYSSRGDRLEGGCPFYGKDLDWARDTIVPTLDTLYGDLAARRGIEFLSLRDAAQGKEVCAEGVRRASTGTPAAAPGQDALLEWIRFGNPLVGGVQGEVAELLHPNALGQQAIGTCLGQVWNRTNAQKHVCVRTGATPQDMAVL
jgi:lysophospholipase L1-like esterase